MTPKDKEPPKDQVLSCTKVKGGITTQAIARKTKIPASRVSQILQRLYKDGQVNRFPWTRNSFRYEFMSDQPIYIPERSDLKRGRRPPVDRLDLAPRINNKSLYSLLSKWAQQQWEPKIFSSARNLPLGIARLYQLAVDIAYGAAVDRSEIDSIRTSISEFYQDLERTLAVVQGILINEDLWLSEFAVYLIENKDPEELQKLINQVKEIN